MPKQQLMALREERGGGGESGGCAIDRKDKKRTIEKVK